MTTLRASWQTAADPRRRIGWSVEPHDTIASTNDRARTLLASSDGSGVAVVAELQTAGRGRQGRTWTSPRGVNLMVSVGLRPALAAGDAWMLGAATALALREACARVLPVGAGRPWLKWPNDVVDAEGRKIAGILVETAITGDRLAEAVVGVGVNANWPRSTMPPEIRERAVSLCDLADGAVDRVALLGAYLEELDERVAAVEAGESPLDAYREASWLDGRPVRVTLGSREIDGRVAGIGAGGRLILETGEGRLRLEHGEVLRVGSADPAGPAQP
jgi:BirA family biotin operon repressor/biotin-[acetyl-CoA-carboxylase] ligase